MNSPLHIFASGVREPGLNACEWEFVGGRLRVHVTLVDATGRDVRMAFDSDALELLAALHQAANGAALRAVSKRLASGALSGCATVADSAY